MMPGTQFIIHVNDEVINQEMIDRDPEGNSSSFDFVPRIGDEIEYCYFNESNYQRYGGKILLLKVIKVRFRTQESYNGLHKNKAVHLFCQII